MKNIDKMFSLQNDCPDDKNKSAKVRLIAEIIQSTDYRILQGVAAFQNVFAANYSVSELEKLDNSELDVRNRLLHKLVSFHTVLLECIHSGNGPTLSADDFPNFISEESVSGLLQKINISSEKTNHSNIDGNNALAVFDRSTVKSAQECFDLLPVSVAKRAEISEVEISKNIGNTLYCIDISEFNEIHRHFIDSREKNERFLSAEKIRRRKHRLFKTAFVLLCFGAVSSFLQFGIISETYASSLYAAVLAATILYFIWG